MVGSTTYYSNSDITFGPDKQNECIYLFSAYWDREGLFSKNSTLKAGTLFYIYSRGFVIILNTLYIPNIYVEKCGEKNTIYFCTYTLCNRQWNGICKMLFLQKALFSYLFTLVAIYAAILRRTLTYTHLGKSHFEDVY